MYSLVELEHTKQKPGACGRGGKHSDALQVSPLSELVFLRYPQQTSCAQWMKALQPPRDVCKCWHPSCEGPTGDGGPQCAGGTLTGRAQSQDGDVGSTTWQQAFPHPEHGPAGGSLVAYPFLSVQRSQGRIICCFPEHCGADVASHDAQSFSLFTRWFLSLCSFRLKPSWKNGFPTWNQGVYFSLTSIFPGHWNSASIFPSLPPLLTSSSGAALIQGCHQGVVTTPATGVQELLE